MTKSILLVGVGGQGTILASKLFTIGLMEAGFDVKMSEIHGMSQRGGSVSSQVRFGETVQSPVIDPGSANMIVAFEKMEALRWLDYLDKDGTVVVNDYEIPSISVITGEEDYAGDVLETIESKVKTVVVNAAQLAQELGNPKVMNIILLGTIVKQMKLTSIDWNEIIKNNVKPRFVDINMKALELGMSLIK